VRQPTACYCWRMESYSITCVSIGMGTSEHQTVQADTMAAALLAWLRCSITAADGFRAYPVTPSAASPDFRGQLIHHPTAPGRYYLGESRLDGPGHHTKADWEAGIGAALAIFEAERAANPAPKREYASKRRSSKGWHLRDYPGKHGPEVGPIR